MYLPMKNETQSTRSQSPHLHRVSGSHSNSNEGNQDSANGLSQKMSDGKINPYKNRSESPQEHSPPNNNTVIQPSEELIRKFEDEIRSKVRSS